MVQGVGYEVEVTGRTLQQLTIGETITLHIHHVVREDAQLLFGFLDRDSRELFRVLLSVSRVGPKLALNILSQVDTHSLVTAVHQQDVGLLSSVKGVGKKKAETLLLELKDKLSNWQVCVSDSVSTHRPGLLEEATLALQGLGYKPQQAKTAVERVLEANPSASVQDCVKQALQRMAMV